MKASNSARFLCQVLFALSSVLGFGMLAHGQGIPGYPDDVRYGYDPREVALLPRYCIHTQLFRDNVPGGNDRNEIKRWHGIMGDTFSAMHHYCWALMDINRANLLVNTQQLRTYYLRSAISEIDFVLPHATDKFPLLPELLTKKGEVLIQLGNEREGLRDLRRAIELRPDYWPPYAALSDHYTTIGDPANARKWLEEGLAVSPNVNALKRRLAELDAAKTNSKAAPQ